MEAGEVTRNHIVFLFRRRQMKTRLNSVHDALHTQQRQRSRKNSVLVDVQPDTAVPEFLRDIKEVPRPATEIEDVMGWATVERKVLSTFDVAFNPELGVDPAMHLFDPGRIFTAEFFPRRIFLKLLQQ